MTWNTNTAILARLETFSEETAWTSLVEHFEIPLTRHAQRSGLPPDAVHDVVQEILVAFALAYRKGAYDSTRGRLSAWLYGIARREVAAARRKACLDPAMAMDSAQERNVLDDDDALERIWEEEWRRAILERCIKRVREEVQPSTFECFALQTFEGLGADEVAARLGISLTIAYNSKHRVSRRLQELAREYEDA